MTCTSSRVDLPESSVNRSNDLDTTNGKNVAVQWYVKVAPVVLPHAKFTSSSFMVPTQTGINNDSSITIACHNYLCFSFVLIVLCSILVPSLMTLLREKNSESYWACYNFRDNSSELESQEDSSFTCNQLCMCTRMVRYCLADVYSAC